MAEKNLKRKLLHQTFELSVLVKGVDGVLEIIGGALLFVVKPVQINAFLVFLTQHELVEDAQDFLANYLVKLGAGLSLDAQIFGGLYLLSHGIIKVALILGLWKKKLVAYPIAIIFLTLFIVYQIYRYTYHPAAWLIVLSVFDAFMIFLTWAEYKQIKKRFVTISP